MPHRLFHDGNEGTVERNRTLLDLSIHERDPTRMKVVLLAGGYGTRFGKTTDFLPKPMIPVGPMPILWHIMRYYAHFGHSEFIIATGYKSELLKEFFCNLHIYSNDFTIDFSASDCPSMHMYGEENFRPRVTLAYTGLDTMTGGRIKRIEQYLGDDQEFCSPMAMGLAILI